MVQTIRIVLAALSVLTGCSGEARGRASTTGQDAAGDAVGSRDATLDGAPSETGIARDGPEDFRDAPAADVTSEEANPCSTCASRTCAGEAGACAPAVFVTSKTYTGAIGGVVAADGECASLAQTAGMPGVFRAWLSSPSPADRFIKSSRPYYRLDGVRVAANFSALASTLEAPISVTDQRLDIGFSYVWTATNVDGTATVGNADAEASVDDCAGWTSAETDAALSGGAGESDDTVSEWTAFGPISCSMSARLYCFQQLP